jgi:hypothetical protein
MSDKEFRPQGLLYHYTSAEGLLGIIRSGNLWATHIRYLNDSQEFIDSLRHLKSFIEEFDEELHGHLDKFLRSAVHLFSVNPGAYVLSFTDDSAARTNDAPGDRLSQWRAYCSGGNGFSLGFDPRLIDEGGRGEIIESRPYLTYLHNCVYDPAAKHKILQGAGATASKHWRDFFDEITDAALKKLIESGEIPAGFGLEQLRSIARSRNLLVPIPPGSKDRLAHLRQILMFGLVLNATSMKNEAFSDEKEWRIVIHPKRMKTRAKEKHDPPIKYRIGQFGLTPYVEFPLRAGKSKSPLRRIVVGPCPHPEQSLQATKLFLQNSGIKLKSKDSPEGVEVVESKIPFRYW